VAFLLQTADALQHFLIALVAARFGQSFGKSVRAEPNLSHRADRIVSR